MLKTPVKRIPPCQSCGFFCICSPMGADSSAHG
nr:MAG TPA_asm: Putative zinc ribbon domain [Caudoviricetes sp.]